MHPDKYAQMLAAVYPAIKSADPSAVVMSGGLAFDNWFNQGGPFNPNFLPDLLADGGAQNMDGFKSFTNTIGGLGTGSSQGVQTVVITITGTGLTLSDFENPNSTNTTFAALISPFPNNAGCPTGFVADSGSTVGVNGDTGIQCGASSTTVPEPGTLALFGTGALGLAGFLRRKLFA